MPWGFVVHGLALVPSDLPSRGAHTSDLGKYSHGTTTPDTDAMPQLISLDDAANRIGVSRRTVDRYIKRGEFVALYQMPTGLLRCDEHELNGWLASRRIDNNQVKETT